MPAKTGIEWTDRTWNPVRGCSRVSPGCVNCYAERQAARFAGTCIRHGAVGCTTCTDPSLKAPFNGFATKINGHPAWTGKVELIESKLTEPLHWKKPQRVFVNSMSDLFHESLPDEAIDRVFAVMALCPHITFQVLTKRAKRMREYFSQEMSYDRIAVSWNYSESARRATVTKRSDKAYPWGQWPLPNVWLGVSAEDKQRADERIPELLQTPATVRFVSYEPALGPVDFAQATPCGYYCDESVGHVDHGFITPGIKSGIDWLIIGGESGPMARPFNVEWARGAIEQCKVAGVPVFMKQFGANPRTNAIPGYDDAMRRIELKDRKGGDMAEWPEWARVREFPKCQ